MNRLLTLMLALIPMFLAADTIYTWTDHRGVIHYSAKPPKNHPDARMITKPVLHQQFSKKDVEESKGGKEKNLEAPTPVSNQDDQPEQKSPETIAYCKKLESNIRALQGSPRVRVKREDGQYDILDDNGRQVEIDRIQKLIKEFCS